MIFILYFLYLYRVKEISNILPRSRVSVGGIGLNSKHSKENWAFQVKNLGGKLLKGNIQGRGRFWLNSRTGFLLKAGQSKDIRWRMVEIEELH